MDIPNGSEDYKRRNPHLFGLGAVVSGQPEPCERSESQDRRMEASPSSVAYRITLVTCRRRLLDSHDNARAALKPLVDAIAESIGLADADHRIQWEYAQCRTDGQQGVLVKIELSDPRASGSAPTQ